jgi:predicted permease
MGIPLLRGRDFTAADGIEAAPVAIVNEAMAERFWRGRDPLGARIGVGDDPLRTVVGVVSSVRQSRLEDEPQPEMFWPQLQSPYHRAAVVARTAGDPMALVPALQEAVRSVDRELALASIATGEEIVSRSLDSRRLPLGLIGLFAALAVLLATVGLAGVVSYGIGLRTREFGLRLALGAEKRSLMRLVLGDALLLAGAGIGTGVLASLYLARFLNHLLYGVGSTDPGTLSAVAFLLGGASALAGYLLARRATRVDPMAALRHE